MKLRNIILGICIVFCLLSCRNEDLDDLVQVTEADLIAEDSDLFYLLDRVTTDDPNATDITCIDFIYSFTVVIYNEDIELESQEVVSNDQEFNNILESVEDGQYINVSFPISSTLEDGTSFEIANKDELQAAIDACIDEEQEQIIGNGTIVLTTPCVWEVQIPEDAIYSTYIDAVFMISDEGIVDFFYRGELYHGTWILYFIEDELHININLDTEEMVGIDWNFDWKVNTINNAIIDIEINDETRFILEKECEPEEFCTTLTFEECEFEETSGISSFILENYKECIVIIAAPQPEVDVMGELLDPIDWVITFYMTQEDAETNVNVIPSDVIIETNMQEVYVRIEDPNTQEFTITTITLLSVECEE